MRKRAWIGILLLMLCSPRVQASTEGYAAIGNSSLTYSEPRSQLQRETSAEGGYVGFRLQNVISILDFAVDSGAYSFEESDQDKTVTFQSDYLNLLLGFGSHIIANVLEWNIEFGYKWSSNDLIVKDDNLNSGNVIILQNKKNINQLGKFEVKWLVTNQIYLGILVEKINGSVDFQKDLLDASVSQERSIYLSLGYRFGLQDKIEKYSNDVLHNWYGR